MDAALEVTEVLGFDSYRASNNAACLEAAGYVFNGECKHWDRGTRVLAGEIAEKLTREQLAAWLAAGVGRRE